MFSILVCCCLSGAIGKNGNIIHSIKEDLQFFKNTTLNHTVIVGRNTYESIPNRLPGRNVIVISSNQNYKCKIREDIIVASSFEQAVEITQNEGEVFIIGGSFVYEQALKANIVDKIYLTLVLDDCEGDSYFKNFVLDNWTVVNKEEFVTSKNLPYQRLILLKKR